jgi:hypothetical protein
MVVEMPSGSKPISPTMVPSSAGGLFRKGMAADRSIAMTGETAADLTAAGATVGAKPEPEIENMESCHASGGVSELPGAWLSSALTAADVHARPHPDHLSARQPLMASQT